MKKLNRLRKHLALLGTEQQNPQSANLDNRSALQIARIMNTEDANVSTAVRQALPQIAAAIDLIADSLKNGGRLIYVGTGTSGRIAALDAAECPPTFSTDPKLVQFIIAGGLKALGAAVESNEDSAELGKIAMSKKRPGERDVVVGIAASGRTPFTIAALKYARAMGAKTVAVVCNPHSELESAAHIGIYVETGAEVISGSTRMKAGTAQKMVLNMLTTGAMTRMGYVYGNLMVNVRPNNQKLAIRAASILQKATNVSKKAAHKALKFSRNNVPAALVMLEGKVGLPEAEESLKVTNGNVRKAIAYARRIKRT
jgi:N-acetylmuramic acid 6-phosphate etherase